MSDFIGLKKVHITRKVVIEKEEEPEYTYKKDEQTELDEFYDNI